MGILARAQLMNRVNVAGGDSGVSVRSVSGCQGLLVRSWGRYGTLFMGTDGEVRGKAARKDKPVARVVGPNWSTKYHGSERSW